VAPPGNQAVNREYKSYPKAKEEAGGQINECNEVKGVCSESEP